MPAALWSSTIFAILHVDMIGAFVFGLAMCLAYTRTGSLVVPIVLHAVNNALALVLSAYDDAKTWGQFLDFGPTVAIIFVISTVILAVYIVRAWPRPYWRLPLFATTTPEIPQPIIAAHETGVTPSPDERSTL